MIHTSFARPAGVMLAVALALVLLPSAPRTAAAGGEYYYNRGRQVPLGRSTTRLALRVPRDVPVGEALARAAQLASVRAARDVKAGGIVEATVADARSVPPDLLALGRELGGVLPVFFESGGERESSTLFVTDELLAQFAPAVSRDRIEDLNARHGVEIVEPLAYAPNGYRMRVVGGDRDALAVANLYFESGLCAWAHPNFLAFRRRSFAPNDPQYFRQWHLKNTGQGGGVVGADVKAEAAWNVTQGSASVSVAVADTGIDWHHEDLAVTIDGVAKIHSQRDVVHGDDDPFPEPGDQDGAHGTAASGVAVAAFDNGLDTAGIAPKCRLIPIQLYAESTFTPNATEADAFTWAADHGAAVMSNSWGPDNADAALPDATRAAIDYATTSGRGGKGVAIFFSAGNNNFDTIHNNYANYAGCIAVAASTNSDVKASYSNFGEAVSVAAPSSGGSRSITTSDVTGAGGYGPQNFTVSFGGTSSACPLAAGVAALALSVNPNLTWRQVKRVLEQSADKIDAVGGAYDARGHSAKYGYGRVNAHRAVQLAVAGGPDTPGLYDASTAGFFLRNSNTAGPAESTFSYAGSGLGLRPIAGDWDANDTDTVGVYDPATRAFFLRDENGPGPANLAFHYGPSGAVPLAGDWNGDGVDSIGVYVPATGTFFLKNTNAPGPADVAFAFGPAGVGWAPIAGDWDGDGIDTIGLYDGASGAFFLRGANAPGPADVAFTFGGAGAGFTPLAGDWDNSGADSIGLYYPAGGSFFLRNLNGSGPADWAFGYGPVGSLVPLAANWDGQ